MMKQNYKNRYQFIALCLALGLVATACGNTGGDSKVTLADSADSTSKTNNENDTSVTNDAVVDTSGLFSERDISGEYDAAKCDSITLSDDGSMTDSKNVKIDGNTITINGEGDYIISGTLSNGMIVIDVDKTERVQLVLNGVDINCELSAAIYVRKADKVFVTLADGTENILSNGGKFEAVDDNNIDAVIFSKDDLTLNGTGTVTINSPSGHGIVSKNELVITGGIYDITASTHGVTGKDSVAIADGKFNITAGKDAIKSDNSDDDTVGNVYIMGGNYTLNAESDGINALNEINISSGKIVVTQSHEGLEARVINISGGEVDITSDDDGINATDKRESANKQSENNQPINEHPTDMHNAANKDNSEKMKGFGGGMGDTEPDASINISGGIIRINAEGDGIDSNGYITVSGGETYVTGPSNGGNGALDYGIDATISGGIVVAAGQSNMSQNFGEDSTQGSILVNTQEQNDAGGDIILLDSSGNQLLAWTMEKRYNSVVISCPEIREDGVYMVKTGDISTEIAMEGLIYGQGGMFGFGGGRPDFMNGERPEGMPEPPEFRHDEKQKGEMPIGEWPEGMPEPPEFRHSEKQHDEKHNSEKSN